MNQIIVPVNEELTYQRFGQLLRHHRETRKRTQQEFADAVNLSRTSISNIESGRQRVLLHQVFEFAKALDLAPEALFPSYLKPASAANAALAESELEILSQSQRRFVEMSLADSLK